VPSAPRTPLTRLLLTLGAACILVLLGAVPASAHAALVSINPPDGAVLSAPPSEVQLHFNQGIRTPFAVITLTSTDGTHPTLPDPVVNGSTVTQALPALTPGLWTLAYRLLPEDGHPIQGTSRFTTTTAPPASNAAAPPAAASPQTPAPTPAASTPTQNTAQPAENGASSALTWTLAVLTVLIAATGVAVALRRNHPSRPKPGSTVDHGRAA